MTTLFAADCWGPTILCMIVQRWFQCRPLSWTTALILDIIEPFWVIAEVCFFRSLLQDIPSSLVYDVEAKVAPASFRMGKSDYSESAVSDKSASVIYKNIIVEDHFRLIFLLNS